jgi:hypothetical protein
MRIQLPFGDTTAAEPAPAKGKKVAALSLDDYVPPIEVRSRSRRALPQVCPCSAAHQRSRPPPPRRHSLRGRVLWGSGFILLSTLHSGVRV